MKNKTLLIVIAIVVVVGLWAFSGYNGMVDKQEEATTALSNVETQYQRRADYPQKRILSTFIYLLELSKIINTSVI